MIHIFVGKIIDLNLIPLSDFSSIMHTKQATIMPTLSIILLMFIAKVLWHNNHFFNPFYCMTVR